MADQFKVEYACDENGDHTAPMAECTESNVRNFDTEAEKLNFIAECTYVYDLDCALGNSASVHKPNPILDCLEESCI